MLFEDFDDILAEFSHCRCGVLHFELFFFLQENERDERLNGSNVWSWVTDQSLSRERKPWRHGQ
jgi:hypothetical protein